jgi:rod shape-determining protein MreB and related proteins
LIKMANLFNFTKNYGVDLGTANTVIIHDNQILINEPSIVAIDTVSKKVVAVGTEAMNMHEKTHENLKTIKPLRDGVIADYFATEQMIQGMLKKIAPPRILMQQRRFLICIPYCTTEVEKRAVRDSAQQVGGTDVYMIHEPIAAALGIGLNIREAEGTMLVDIGGGTTEIVVISLSGIVCSQSIRIAGNSFDADIIDYIRKEHNLLIGERTAEKIKVAIGTVVTDLSEPPPPYKVLGRDLLTGIPKATMVNYQEIATVLDRAIQKIEEAILRTLEECPPELAGDIHENGIYLTGGGAFLRGISSRIGKRTGLPIHIAPEPLLSVTKGVWKALGDLAHYKDLLLR